MLRGRVAVGLFAAVVSLHSVSDAEAQITNIQTFLEQCPTNDPAYSRIRQDFRILRNAAAVGSLSCSEPISMLPITQYTDELIMVQGLRVLYYMDRGRANHLPWTPLPMYDWMKTKIRGFNLSDTAGGSSCCQQIDGEWYVVIRTQDDFNRDFDRTWRGIEGNIGLYGHEARHRDGFPHDSGCGIVNGCDPVYDESNLSAYGIQWWLEANWLSGNLYVGFSCLDAGSVAQIANWHLSSANNTFRRRFSSNPPPVLSLPPQPGGTCRGTTPAPPGTPTNVQATAIGSVLTVLWSAPSSGPVPTGYRLDFYAGAQPVATVPTGPSPGIALQIPSGVQGTFTVTVTALAGGAAGAPSTPHTFTIGGPTCTAPPSAPTGLSGAIIAGVASVSWTASSGATSYIVQAGTVDGSANLFNANVGNTTMVGASGLPPGFQAFVRVIAANACGQSSPSPTILLR